MRWISSSCGNFSPIPGPTEFGSFSPLHPPVLQGAIPLAADAAQRLTHTPVDSYPSRPLVSFDLPMPVNIDGVPDGYRAIIERQPVKVTTESCEFYAECLTTLSSPTDDN